MARAGIGWLLGIALCVAGCGSSPTTRALAQDAAAAMGSIEALRAVQTLTMSGGTGSRYRLGQTVRVTDQEMPGQLANVIETVDLPGGRAALDYEIKIGEFSQHRQEVLTKQTNKPVGLENVTGRPLAVMAAAGLFSWGTQNSPEFLLRRNVVAVVLAGIDAPAGDAPQDKTLDGRTLTFGTASLPSGEKVGLYFDPATRLLAAYETTDTEAILGDVPAQYLLSDYKDVSGVKVPHKITIRKGGQPYSEVQFASAAINDAAALKVFDVPAAATKDVERVIFAGASYSPVTITKVADGVHFARAYSHNSLVVEFPSMLAVVEAPYTEAQSLTLARALREQFPDKPIRYAAVTHHHYDHVGGVRGMAAEGATVLVARGHEEALRPLLESAHTNPPDALQNARNGGRVVGVLEVYDDKKVIEDGPQSLELYVVSGIPHVEPKVLAYVPRSRVLFQSDLFFPGTGAPASPDAVALLQAVRKLNLRVDINAGGHGGFGPFAELVKAAGAAGTN